MKRLPGSRAASRLGLALWLVLGCSESSQPPARSQGDSTASAPATYVGSQACAGCHPGPTQRWRGSDHDLAMQTASESSVVADFDGATIDHFGVESRFSRRGDKYIVHTEGSDGSLREFEIAYTLGFEPLQQYLVRFPGGRLQALGLAWDARPAASGGQRWFHLYPDAKIAHDDLLHWTARSQNWNSMCAECHSTALEKNYDLDSDSYRTSWKEIDVGCEACHGPGSAHMSWAQASATRAPDNGLTVDLRNIRNWVFDANDPIAHREGARSAGTELDVCAPCHSRRSVIHEPAGIGEPFLDNHRPTLLGAGLYHADGQIQDEVYVWGSFVQSRMYAAGVTCSDCHDPHALDVDPDLDAVCARCHQPESFAVRDHHHHEPGAPGSRCVDCHMPARTYMLIDDRRDHSFRVPRPELSQRIGAPDACSQCHTNRGAAWSGDALRSWQARTADGGVHFGDALHAGRRGATGSGAALAALANDGFAPPIARASALELLRGSTREQRDAITNALRHEDPLIRMAAADAAERLEPRARVRALLPLLRDPVRAVRIAAAMALASAPTEVWPTGARSALADPIGEYRAAQRANAEQPESHVNLGILHVRFGEYELAAREYEHALRLRPEFVPGYVNLADLQRIRGRDDEGEKLLRRALEQAPDNAEVHHALGLLLVRERRLSEAQQALDRAARLAPDQPRYAYVRGIALHSSGQTERAIAVLDDAHRRHPSNRDLLVALVTINRDRGTRAQAREYAARLLALAPDDETVHALIRELSD